MSNNQRTAVGAAARPLEFPTPRVSRCVMKPLSVLDHRSGRIHSMKRVLVEETGSGPQPVHAYVIKRKTSKTTYGMIYVGVVLRHKDLPDLDSPVQWESTEQLVSIKASSFRQVEALRGKNLRDPLKEIAALQHIGSHQSNVVGCIAALQDDDYLYGVSPYYSGGDLYGRLMGNRQKSVNQAPVDEQQVRVWFQQLLNGLSELQQKGVCHRNIALENLMLSEDDALVIGNLSLALRVPYMDNSNPDGVCDVSEGSRYRPMPKQGVSGNLMYLAPEIIEGCDIDGYAIDVWSSGVILFLMLVGMAPFRWAHASDSRYFKVSRGNLKQLVKEQGIELSESAVDLLQKILQRDPARRLSIAEILSHPWMREGDLFTVGSLLRLERTSQKYFNTFPPPAPSAYESPAPLDVRGCCAW